jgi:hypothetical protein
LLAWIKENLHKTGRVSDEDLDIVQVLDDPEEIVATVKRIVII